MPLRLIFMGTPEFAVPTLTEIVNSGHEVVAVYTRAPKPAGRGAGGRAEVARTHVAAEGFGIPGDDAAKSLRQEAGEGQIGVRQRSMPTWVWLSLMG